MDKKKIVFIISAAAFTLLFALLAVFVFPKKKYTFPLDTSKTDIIIVGDSLYANGINDVRELASFVLEATDAEVQNCSIGGTTASKLNKGNEVDYYGDLLNFHNVSNIICTHDISSVSDNVKSLTSNYDASYVKMKYLVGTDLNKEDFLIVNYGINDVNLRVRTKSENPYDEYTFAGAMRAGIKRIHEKYPDLKIIIGEVTYTTYIQNGEPDESFDEVTGTYRVEYNEELKKIANEFDNVYFFEISQYMEINKDNYETYLADGLHLNEEGKKRYSAALAEYLEELK